MKLKLNDIVVGAKVWWKNTSTNKIQSNKIISVDEKIWFEVWFTETWGHEYSIPKNIPLFFTEKECEEYHQHMSACEEIIKNAQDSIDNLMVMEFGLLSFGKQFTIIKKSQNNRNPKKYIKTYGGVLDRDTGKLFGFGYDVENNVVDCFEQSVLVYPISNDP